MEKVTPAPVIQPEDTKEARNETSAPFHPLINGMIRTAVEVAKDIGREAIAPELGLQQPIRRPGRREQEQLDKLAMEEVELEAELLRIQSPGHALNRFFGESEALGENANSLATVRAELATLVNMQPVGRESGT